MKNQQQFIFQAAKFPLDDVSKTFLFFISLISFKIINLFYFTNKKCIEEFHFNFEQTKNSIEEKRRN